MAQNFQPPAPSSYTEAPAPAPARSGNLGLAIVAAVVAALASAAAYGWIMDAAGEVYRYAAVGVGILVGFAAGKIGGRNGILGAVAAVLTVGAVYLGQLLFISLALSDIGGIGLGGVLDKVGVSGLNEIWKEGTEAMDYAYMAFGALVAFGAVKKGSH